MRVFHWRYFHAPSACGSILGTIMFRDSKKSMNFCLLMEKSKYVVAVCTYLQKKIFASMAYKDDDHVLELAERLE